MSRSVQRFNPRCMICKRAKRPHNAIELLRSDSDGAWVRCKICGRESYRRSWAARHRAMKPNLPTATDDNQLGAHLCRLWDGQKAELGSGKWVPTLGRFVALPEWTRLKGGKNLNIGDKVTVKNRLSKIKRYASVGRRAVNAVEWVPFPTICPVHSAIYLGKVTLYNGDTTWEDEEVGYIFKRTGQVNAVVVQPLDGNRYRRPVYALPEDVEAVQP